MGHPSKVRWRLGVFSLVLILLGCDNAVVTSAPGSPGAPIDTAAPGSTIGPEGSGGVDPDGGPGGVDALAGVPPLPIPTLTEPFAIGQAFYDPASVGDAVVSMLKLLGIAVYEVGGKVVLPGGETTSADVWLYDTEVWALIDMGVDDLLASESGDLPWGLGDLHEALVGVMPDTTLDTFVAAYRDSYADHPADLAPTLLLGQPIDESTRLTRPQAWLLYLDGFVDLAKPTAAYAPGPLLAVNAGLQFGTARRGLPPLMQPQSLSYAQWTQLKPHFMTIVATIPFAVGAGNAHEGHGGTGQVVSIRAQLRAGRPLISPATGDVILQPSTGTLGGLPVRWTSPDVNIYADHGTLAQSIPGQGQTDAGGDARISYTPKREAANGQGQTLFDSARISATASVQDLFQHAYGLTDSTIIRFLVAGRIGGSRTVSDYTAIAWHAKGISLSISNTYDVTVNAGAGPLVAFAHRSGTDTWVGTIVRGGDGTYRGTLIAQSKADAQMDFAGGLAAERCEDSTDTAQYVDVVGRVEPAVGAIDPHLEALQDGDFGPDDLVLRFYPKTPPEAPGRCQGVIDYFGPGPNGRLMRGSYISINDSRFTDPSLGYRIHLPVSGHLDYEDRRLIAANQPPNAGVHSIFKIVIDREPGT